MDNALLKDNAFMVNAVLDTVKFNQLKGRKITAFFANNNIDRMFVDGNAENLVFSTNDKTNKITEMFHDRASRIKIRMEGKKIIDYVSIRKVDQKVYPFRLVTQEIEVLPGFLWKPEDRPKSVEDMLNRKRTKSTPTADQKDSTNLNPPEGNILEDSQGALDKESENPITPKNLETQTGVKKDLKTDTPINNNVDASGKVRTTTDSTLKIQPDSTLIKSRPDSTLKAKPDSTMKLNQDSTKR